MLFSLLKKWQRAAAAKRSIADLKARVDAPERTHGYGMKWLDQLPHSPIDHIQDAPLETKEFWVKQINLERLTDLGRAALGAAFVGFADQPSDEKGRREFAEFMSTHLGVRFAVDPKIQRRYAGDHTLPRGRYYALCDAQGNDQGTLVGELRAYYEPKRVGVVQMFDCTLPDDLQKVSGGETPVSNPKQLVFKFPPINGNANPFVKTSAGVIGHADFADRLGFLMLSIGLPLTVRKLRREKVLDLREPSTGTWLARTLSTLEWQPDGIPIRCFPQRPPLEQLGDLLPELLLQENGGGGASVAVGLLLRYLGADGLIFPSARNDAAVLIEGGKVVSHHGWNFVDYANTSSPEFFAWIEQGKQWPTQVGFRPYGDAPADETPVWYPDVTLASHPDGSWQVQGLRRRTNLRWRMKLLRYALDCSRGELSELAWATLYVFPELLAKHGKIDFAGEVSKLVFEAVLGLDETGEGLAALREQLMGIEDYRQSFGEVLEKVHRSSREKWKTIKSIHIIWQGIDSD
jgi:hypothetical protein